MAAFAVAVIGGTGAEGSAIALRLAAAGHRIAIGTRDTAKGEKVATGLNELLGRPAIEFKKMPRPLKMPTS
jgi:predicted dinucleotide-binding enzyme